MKRGLIVFSLLLILSLSVVSASSFSDFWNKITGKVTNENSCFSETGEILSGDFYCSSDISDGEIWIQNYYCNYGKLCVECENGYEFKEGNCVVKQIAPVPVDGKCGSSNGQTFSAKPTTNLCLQGISSTITETSSKYSWTCAGNNGGITKSCSAIKQVSSTQTETTPTITCTDSDGGKNYSVKGEVTGTDMYGTYQEHYADFCDSKGLLVEKYCDDNKNADFQSYNCPNGCENGVCKEETKKNENSAVEPGQTASNENQNQGNENANEESGQESGTNLNAKTLIKEELYESSRDWKSCVESEDGIEATYPYNLIFWKMMRTTNLVDKCMEENTFREYFCDEQKPGYRDYKCSEGCNEGECIGAIAKENVGVLKINITLIYLEYANHLEDVLFEFDLHNSNYLLKSVINIQVDATVLKEDFRGERIEMNLVGPFQRNIIKTLEMYDDGLHNDNKRNDGIYGNLLDKNTFLDGTYFINLNLLDFKEYPSRESYVAEGSQGDGGVIKLFYFLGRGNLKLPTSENIGANCEAVWYTGDSKENLDIVFVGDKWNNLEEFGKEINLTSMELLSEPTFNAYKNKINIWMIEDLSDVGCKYNEACTSIGGILGTVISLIPIGSDGSICCNGDKTKKVVNKCPHDVIVVKDNVPSGISTGSVGGQAYVESSWGKFFSNKLNPFKYALYILFGDLNKFNVLTVVVNEADGLTVAHELGHMMALLPDYSNTDPSCDQHPCLMCYTGDFMFGNQDLCIDRARMVEQLNQLCDAKVSVITKNPASPYPNPYNPNKCTIKSEYYPGKCSQKIKYKVEYPNSGEPCYILMHIYDVKGAEVRVLVSDEPQTAGEYIFEWDGTNNDRIPVVSGTYFYIVTGGSDSKTIKGTLVK